MDVSPIRNLVLLKLGLGNDVSIFTIFFTLIFFYEGANDTIIRKQES